MNTGQTMLSVAALTLLTIITLRYFASVGQSGQTLTESNSGLTATTIATSFIERAQNTAFDEKSEGTPINQLIANPAILTSSMGLETGEDSNLDSLDDFDDFAFYNDGNPLLYTPEGINETYRVSFNVYYVDTNNVNAEIGAGHNTFLKKMDVTVRRDSVRVKLSAIYGLFRY